MFKKFYKDNIYYKRGKSVSQNYYDNNTFYSDPYEMIGNMIIGAFSPDQHERKNDQKTV